MEKTFAAILLMAGEGRRLKSPLPKQFHLLGSQKIYQYTLQTLMDSVIFQQIILVCHPTWVAEVEREIPQHSSLCVVAGGPTRQASSWLGLQSCHPKPQYVMIHDCVRPFVSQDILERNRAAVLQHSAVDTCIPSTDTLVQYEEQLITAIPPRHNFLRGQTPQTFEYQLIVEAHRKTQQTEATDDCSLVLEQGHPITIVLGEEDNMKITTEWDVKLAQWLFLQ